MADVLLINPYILKLDRGWESHHVLPYPPLGLMYLAGILREKGYQPLIYDGIFKDGIADIERYVDGVKPKIAGVTALNHYRRSALETIRMLKRKGITVLAGGPDATIYDQEYLKAGCDIVVKSEGEETIVELMEHLEGARERKLEDIKGISYLKNGIYFSTPAREPIKDVDGIPYPAYDMIEVEKYFDLWRSHAGYSSLPLFTSRGCPFSCKWCARPVFGRRFNQRSPENVVSELKYILDRYPVEYFRIIDDVFIVKKKWIDQFYQAVKDSGLKFRFECLSRVSMVDRETLRKLREIGCEKIFFGVESGSQKVLDAMKKGIKVEETLKARELMREVGMTFYAYLMYGYPGEKYEDVLKTVDLVKRLAPMEYSISIAYPMPGTEFYDEVKERLLPKIEWDESGDERVLFETEYPKMFYRFAKALTHREYKLGLKFNPRTFLEALLLRFLMLMIAAFGDSRRGRPSGEPVGRLEEAKAA
jgi:radical SAM superfamily enzyme YgiQ (UPF0313 family)